MRNFLLLITIPAVFAATPAESRIAAAKAALASPSATTDAYAELAKSYLRRARETSDGEYVRKAQEAVDTALKADAANFEVQKAQCETWIAGRQFAKALTLAQQLTKRTPDDLAVHGYLADAYLGLDKVNAAEKEVQWMLDLRPGNVPGMVRGAELRRLFGDPEGAIDWFNQAFRRIRPEDTEERAYLLTRISEALLAKGDGASAVRAAEQSLKLFPDYPLGEEQLKKARLGLTSSPSSAKTLPRAE